MSRWSRPVQSGHGMSKVFSGQVTWVSSRLIKSGLVVSSLVQSCWSGLVVWRRDTSGLVPLVLPRHIVPHPVQSRLVGRVMSSRAAS